MRSCFFANAQTPEADTGLDVLYGALKWKMYFEIDLYPYL